MRREGATGLDIGGQRLRKIGARCKGDGRPRACWRTTGEVMASTAPACERKIIGLLAAVSFVNILDFMMVMPLGPDFAQALGIPASKLGIIGGSYTVAAAVAGLAGALFLDR